MLNLLLAAAIVAAPAEPIELSPKLQEAWGQLAFSTGLCTRVMTIDEQLDFKSLIEKAPPYRRGFMLALYKKGLAYKDKSIATRHKCVAIIREDLNNVQAIILSERPK